MAEASKSDDIGMRRGKVIANLTQSQQLDLIAEGLPILMTSASELFEAAARLDRHQRAANILEGHGIEESAKVLILMDIVRCPPAIRSSRIGWMMKWFYDHLARLIYADAQSWRPTDAKELQPYIDSDRQSHYLGGGLGEYIVPNSTLYRRESVLYADIETYEDGLPRWSEPRVYPPTFSRTEPSLWRVCKALSDMGAFTRAGPDIASHVWAQTNFIDVQNWNDTQSLTHEMLLGLRGAGLIAEAATDAKVSLLYDAWQMPMYQMNFTRIDVPLADLQSEREASLWREGGY